MRPRGERNDEIPYQEGAFDRGSKIRPAYPNLRMSSADSSVAQVNTFGNVFLIIQSFFYDLTGSAESLRGDDTQKQAAELAPVWVDDDDAVPHSTFKPSWAVKAADTEVPTLVSYSVFERSTKSCLPVHKIQYRSKKSPLAFTRKKIANIDFHLAKPWLLVTGMDNVITIYDVSDSTHRVIQQKALKGFDLTEARFVPKRDQILLVSPTRGLKTWDLRSGKIESIKTACPSPHISCSFSLANNFCAVYGKCSEVIVFSTKNWKVMGIIRCESTVSSLAFDRRGELLFLTASGNRIHVWNVLDMTCLNVVRDDSGVCCTYVATSYDGRFLAVGADSGIVSLYLVSNIVESSLPKPIKTIENLTERITSIAFHPSSELFAINSSHMKGGIRLVHLSSGTTFHNFPGLNMHLGRTKNLLFSPKGDTLFAFSESGKFNEFDLQHYSEETQ